MGDNRWGLSDRICCSLLALMSLLLVGSAPLARAGPNANGVLVLYTDPAIDYSTDAEDRFSGIGCPDFSDCSNPDNLPDFLAICDGPPGGVLTSNLVDEGGMVDAMVWLLAAFPYGECPRVSGITWGIVYSDIEVAEFGTRSDFEIRDPEWPGSNTGTAVTWDEPKTSNLFEVYWFHLYGYYYNGATFGVRSHPSQGGVFADDSIPAAIDVIQADGYGEIGIGSAAPGSSPISLYEFVSQGPPFAGGCCLPDGSCTITTGAECQAAENLYLGDESGCDPNPCPNPTVPTTWGWIKKRFAP